jgi:hypothetical protein
VSNLSFYTKDDEKPIVVAVSIVVAEVYSFQFVLHRPDPSRPSAP